MSALSGHGFGNSKPTSGDGGVGDVVVSVGGGIGGVGGTRLLAVRIIM